MHSVATAGELRLATMLAGIAVVLLTGVLLSWLVRRVRQPAVIGEISAGILLGPSALGLLPGDLPNRIFPADVRPLLSAVSQVGLILFMFMVGWGFEKRMLRPNRGKAATLSLSSVALPFALSVGLAAALYPQHSEVAGRHISFLAFAMFLAAAMSVTAFPVLARILTDNGLAGTRVGALALAGAAVNDVLAWCLLAYVSALVTAGGDTGDLVRTAGLSAVYVTLMFVLVRPLLDAAVTRWSRRGHWRSLLSLLCAAAFLSSWVTTWIGIHAIFGAFLLGFVMPREPAALVVEHLLPPLDHIGLVLLPVFFIVTGLSVDIGGLSPYEYLELAAIVAVACAGKMLGAMAPARALGLSWREARALGLLMNTRGLTELIILNAAVSLGVLDSQMFTMMVIMALVTTALAGPLLPRRALLDEPPPGAGEPVRLAEVGAAPAADPPSPRRPLERSPDSHRQGVPVTRNQALDQAPDQAQPIDTRALRSVCGLFVTGVTVITTGTDGRSVGTTVNSFTSVSLEPPLVLFCLHRDSRLRGPLEESRMFVVNFLARQQEGLAWAFAGKATAGLQSVAYHPSGYGLPILSQALAFLACRIVNEFDGGDHVIFVGEVLELGTPRRNEDPLIFFRGSLGALEDEPYSVQPILDG